MFVHDYRRLFSSKQLPNWLPASCQWTEREGKRDVKIWLPKSRSPGQLKRNRTHTALGGEAVQVSLNSFQGFASGKVQEESRSSTEELIPAQWSFDISPHHQSPVRLWPGGTAVVATLESSGLLDGVIHSPPAAAVFGLKPSHFKAAQITLPLSKKHETRNRERAQRIPAPAGALAHLSCRYLGGLKPAVTPPERILCPLACAWDRDGGRIPLKANSSKELATWTGHTRKVLVSLKSMTEGMDTF